MNYLKNNIWVWLFVAIGAVAGYMYWRFVGCASGTCPITSRWYTSAIYGAFFGYFLGGSVKEQVEKHKEKKSNENIVAE